MKLEIVKIVGSSLGKGWSQVHTFLPEEKEKLNSRGEFLAVISLTGLSPGLEIASAGRELISRLHEEYYGSLEESPFIQLRKAVERVFQEAGTEARVEIVAGCLLENVLYLAVAGGGRIVLWRQGKIATILQGSPEESWAKTASGYIGVGDIFLLGTKRFFEVVPEGTMKAALESGSAQQTGEILAPVVLGKEEGLAAAVIAETEEEKGPVEIEEAEKEKEIRKIRGKVIKELLLKVKQKITEKPSEKPKKSFFTVALLLFLILGVSMVFGAKERKRQAQEEKIKVVLEQVKAKKEEGEAIISLNPAKAIGILKEAKELLRQIEKEKIPSLQLDKLKQELEVSLNSVLREYEVETKLFFDLELIKKGAMGGDFVIFGDKLVILDNQNLAVYSLGIVDKKSTILAGGEKITGASQLATFGSKVFVLGDEGIYQISGSSLSMVIKKDRDWQGIRDLETFDGNLYLLDKKGIWFYPKAETGFGEKRSWLKEEVDFSNAVGMAIDGAIWVLKSNGVIEKYLRGSKDVFGIRGLDKEFLSPFGLYTSPEEKQLYVLDKENSRIVVLDKTGEYYSQYKNSQIAYAQNLVVSEKESKIFLLQGSKIYEISLQ